MAKAASGQLKRTAWGCGEKAAPQAVRRIRLKG